LRCQTGFSLDGCHLAFGDVCETTIKIQEKP
jgi:hypothetical protein